MKLGDLVVITGGWYASSVSGSFENVTSEMVGAIGEFVEARQSFVRQSFGVHDVKLLSGPMTGTILGGTLIDYKAVSPLEALAYQADQ